MVTDFRETLPLVKLAPFEIESAIDDLTKWKIPKELDTLFGLRDPNNYWQQTTIGNKDIFFSSPTEGVEHKLNDADIVITVSRRLDQNTHEKSPFEITIAGILETSKKEKRAVSVGYSLLDGGINSIDVVIPTDSVTDLAFYATNKLTKETTYPLDYAGNITKRMVGLANKDDNVGLILVRGNDPEYKHNLGFFGDKLHASKNGMDIKNGKGMTLFEMGGKSESWIAIPSNLIL